MRFLTIALLLIPNMLFAQKWVDTTYQYNIDRDSLYGSAVDFGGNLKQLHLDIAYPTNDTPPSCGRPLVVVLYGGAWMAGNKEVTEVQSLMKDFAKRGYVAVAPNYRLGMFQTEQDRNCNISSLGLEWNCLNAQDTAEWYRAYYRAVQDAKGAVRYIIKHADVFNIDPYNVFITGFSAGGFTALGVGFLDHESEWKDFAGAIDSAKRPNNRYNVGCVQKYQWDTSVSSLDLSRPSLGSFEGNLHPNQSYTIRAVGNLFGGMLYNLLDSGSSTPPAIYGFHQPNDLIVPYRNNQQVFQGFTACAYAFCNLGIINRPIVYSTPVIRDWAKQAPNRIDVQFDSTLNNTNCAGQIAAPSKGGHQLDTWERTWNMARFFAGKIDTLACKSAFFRPAELLHINVYPNPSTGTFTVQAHNVESVRVLDMRGVEVQITTIKHGQRNQVISLDNPTKGVFIVEVELDNQRSYRQRIIVN